jgi:hypothetical protein
MQCCFISLIKFSETKLLICEYSVALHLKKIQLTELGA